MNYKTPLRSLAAILVITLAIIGLSINHHHRQRAAAAPDSPASTALLPSTSSSGIAPVPLAGSDNSVAAGGHCNIERIDGELFKGSASHARTLPIELSGWIVDTATKAVPTNVEILIQQTTSRNAWIVPVSARINRPDVLSIQGNDRAYLRSGFSVHINPAELPDGDYRVLIRYLSKGSLHVCDNGRKVEIAG